MRSMIGNFYSKKLFPPLCEFALSGNFLNRFRHDTLQETKGKVLEIGFGTGLNLAHYPKEVRKIDAVDVNPSMHRLSKRRIEKSAIAVTNHVISGENLPMDDASYDCVACTFTLCSITDVSRALSEVNRVLKRGGKFVFLEHGLSNDSEVQTWQHRLNHFQKQIGDGCHLNRDIDKIVRRASFEITSLKRLHLPVFPRVIGHCYQGIATKHNHS